VTTARIAAFLASWGVASMRGPFLPLPGFLVAMVKVFT
jgi:hypothetical protein